MNIEQNLQKAEELLTVWNKEARHPGIEPAGYRRLGG